jgi:hypothetical protein
MIDPSLKSSIVSRNTEVDILAQNLAILQACETRTKA